jgi:hypothetical protein
LISELCNTFAYTEDRILGTYKKMTSIVVYGIEQKQLGQNVNTTGEKSVALIGLGAE